MNRKERNERKLKKKRTSTQEKNRIRIKMD